MTQALTRNTLAMSARVSASFRIHLEPRQEFCRMTAEHWNANKKLETSGMWSACERVNFHDLERGSNFQSPFPFSSEMF